MARRARSSYGNGYRGFDSDEFYVQPTSAEIATRAQRSVADSAKAGTELHPIVVTGNSIARTWWGKAWGENLKRYASLYHNRIDRGKRYIRAGAVLDLQIEYGRVSGLVQGSTREPYRVDIRILPIPLHRYQEIIGRCSQRVESIESLVEGDFPLELKNEFIGAEGGLFPNPTEIDFFCSCPDSASMCKHVAATLYAVGTRLDEDPLLFFTMRGIDTGDLVQKTINEKLDSMLKNADTPSSRIITLDDDAVTRLFGVL